MALRPRQLEAALVAAIFLIVAVTAWSAMRTFRADGHVPFFYQSNFEPAVLTACGRGFGISPVVVPELAAFLRAQRDDFSCALLPAGLQAQPLASTANANWYYLYQSSALVWRVTGVSWRALDLLVAAMAGLVGIVTYGLMRLAAGPGASAALALLLALSPANLRQLPSLRDYSKAPFVLGAVLILAVLVLRPLRRSTVFALAGLYGAAVGLGYGFRGDLAVMVPFGAVIVLLFLEGPLKSNAGRNAAAAAILLLAFAVVASPVIASLDQGGCQFHFALLGLTGSSSNELHLAQPLYRFGDHALDLFGNLKVGDYATRIMHAPPPELCGAAYDEASGRLYMDMLRTFPADVAVRAYASVLMILRMGMDLPVVDAATAHAPTAIASIFRGLDAAISPLSPIGVLVTFAAIGVACAASWRLGIALALGVLFLTGYPSLRFEERHWFHLRFIPWWAAALVVAALLRGRGRMWSRDAVVRAVAGPVALLAVMVAALLVLRSVQAGTVGDLVAGYLEAPSVELPIDRRPGSRVDVDWQPVDYGVSPEHRGSDLLAVTLDAAGCGAGAEPVTLMVKYDVGNEGAGLDLSTSFTVARPLAGGPATRVFVPVFWVAFGERTISRFVALEVAGASSACVGRVARVTGAVAVPLWLEMSVPPDWAEQPLYQTIEPPPQFKSLIKRPL